MNGYTANSTPKNYLRSAEFEQQLSHRRYVYTVIATFNIAIQLASIGFVGIGLLLANLLLVFVALSICLCSAFITFSAKAISMDGAEFRSIKMKRSLIKDGIWLEMLSSLVSLALLSSIGFSMQALILSFFLIVTPVMFLQYLYFWQIGWLKRVNHLIKQSYLARINNIY